MEQEEVKELEEAIRQLQSGKYFRETKDSPFHEHDIRNPNNTYHEWYLAKKDPDTEWDLSEVYEFCEENYIITKYTPFELIDYRGYLQFLVLRHSIGNQNQRQIVETRLKDLAAKEQEIHDGAREADRRESEGAPLSEILEVTPGAHAIYSDIELFKISDMKPGLAQAAMELLIR